MTTAANLGLRDEGHIGCYIGTGSNLQDPVAQTLSAFSSLADIADTRLLRKSSLYLSDPLGPADQPRYVNAVAQLSTCLPAPELLDQLQRIENEHGRVRGRRWGARTLDLDLLLYGDHCIESERLTVPHPGVSTRAFVLLPLLELEPDINIPGEGSAVQLLQRLDTGGVEKLKPEPLEQQARNDDSEA